MAKRTHYRNGDEITAFLRWGCDSCSPSMVHGTICHELGCPNAWRDYTVECFQCGCDFYPTERWQRTCEDCLNPPDDNDDNE